MRVLKALTIVIFGLSILDAAQKKLAPEFVLSTINGEEVSLSGLRGKVVIIDFWATWCPPCRKEIPDFIELKKKYGKNLEIIGISVDRSTSDVVNFYKKNKMNYPVGMATRGILESYNSIYRIQYIPTTFIVDQMGYIHDIKVGYASRKEFEEAIKALLGNEKN